MPTVKTYRLAQPVRGELHHAVLGRIAFEFDAGEMTPRSEQDEAVLVEMLVPQGRAELADAAARPAKRGAGDDAAATGDDDGARATDRAEPAPDSTPPEPARPRARKQRE